MKPLADMRKKILLECKLWLNSVRINCVRPVVITVPYKCPVSLKNYNNHNKRLSKIIKENGAGFPRRKGEETRTFPHTIPPPPRVQGHLHDNASKTRWFPSICVILMSQQCGVVLGVIVTVTWWVMTSRARLTSRHVKHTSIRPIQHHYIIMTLYLWLPWQQTSYSIVRISI